MYFKGGRCVLCRGVKEKYTFIKSRLHRFHVSSMCRVMQINRSGFYAWLLQPKSDRQREDERLLHKVKQCWLESGFAYGYRNITKDLKDLGEACGKNRVNRIMRQAGIQSKRRYKQHQGFRGGSQHHVASNVLDRQFNVTQPNQVWVTDFTYIRTHEGWLYVTIVLGLFSRQVVGWSMKNRLKADLVIDALLMAVWRRKPMQQVLVHSDQGIQYTCSDWRSFLKENHLEASMSRRGNCWDNAVAESFFSLLKGERIRGRIYPTRREARADIFDYIEMFYNPKRRHGNNSGISPMQYEKQYYEKLLVV